MQRIIEKIGLDRIAHLGIGGLICAIIANILIPLNGASGWHSLLNSIPAAAFVFAISVIKERFMDSKFDWADITYAMLGCLLYIIAVALGLWLNL